jgi:membrane dipeptidase
MKTFYSISLSFLYLVGCQQDNENQLTKKAKKIHERIITLDTHDDIDISNFTTALNYSSDTNTQVNLPKMKSGGLDVVWFIVYTKQGELSPKGYELAAANATTKFDAIDRLTEQYAPLEIGLAKTSKEVRKLIKKGRKVAMIGVENAFPLGRDTSNVKIFYDRGARYMSLAHNGHNQLSDSNTGEFDNTALHNGISELGRQVIEKMNYYGMMVDISHPSKEAIRQTIAYSKAPVIASHSSARSLSDHPRNLDDQQLKWVKESAGVVQVVALHQFVNKEKHEAYKENPQLNPPVDVSDYVDHIDYIKNLIGIDHVGISSDFDGGGGIKGWEDASKTLNVTLELVKRGYTEDEISKIWSGNLLRVLDSVQSIANELQNK